MGANIFVENSINIHDLSSQIIGDGWLEQSCSISGHLEGRFFVGAYSLVSRNTVCINTFIGRFTTIEEGVEIGYQEIKRSNFTTHAFSHDLQFPLADDYYEAIKSRYYYEQDKFTFIGNDVRVGRCCTILEGCTIGDGAIIEPNSYVNDDVPPYAIVSGSPASVIGYRFPDVYINRLVASKWWKKDITSLTSKWNHVLDYIDNFGFIDQVFSSSLPPLIKSRVHINTMRNKVAINNVNRLIIGPSHIYLWFLKYNRQQVPIPNNCHLISISAMSLFSDQLTLIIDWWREWFEDVIMFVPDFRIGNVATERTVKDGRYIKQAVMSSDNSQKCFQLGIESLNNIIIGGKVRLWFWCLYGRESLCKQRGQYINNEGFYHHPIWNYSEIKKSYSEHIIDIASYFESVVDDIVDDSIHPNNDCYMKFCKIFESI